MADWPPAVFSEDGQFRYFLSRRWGDGGAMAFIGLNPSTADATLDDPTIRRCVGFAKAWGAGTLLMTNLFAYRATKPAALLKARDPIGPCNDEWLEKVVSAADIVVAAWGNHGRLMDRSSHVQRLFPGRLHALGLTQSGMPRHPLYVSGSHRPSPFGK